MIRVTVHAGPMLDDLYPGQGEDERPPSTRSHGEINQWDMPEILAAIGREWKNADYFPNRQVIIVFDPVPLRSGTDPAPLIREAMAKLEATGLA